LISRDRGLKHVFRETNGIKKTCSKTWLSTEMQVKSIYDKLQQSTKINLVSLNNTGLPLLNNETSHKNPVNALETLNSKNLVGVPT